MKFIHIRNRAYDRYVREDNEVCLEQRMVRINGRFCWRWCVYADCGGNVVEMLDTSIAVFSSSAAFAASSRTCVSSCLAE